MSLPRIFFDNNSADEDGAYRLWFAQSLADLEHYRTQVAEGAKVIIYEQELEITAILRRDEGGSFWLADPVPGTTKYLDESPKAE